MRQIHLLKDIKTILLFFVGMVFSTSLAQENTNQRIAKGTIHTNVGSTVDFADLEYRNDKVYFSNLATSKRDSLMQSDITFVKVEVKGESTVATSSAEEIKKVVKAKRATNVVLDSIPDGVYDDIESFVNKTPNSHPELTSRVTGSQSQFDYGNTVYFYDVEDSKLRRKFAVKQNGKLYFSLRAIIDNAKKEEDGGMTTDLPNTFVKVIYNNDRFYYVEAEMESISSALLLGYATKAIAGTERERGVVWDAKKHHFDIFRNCGNFNLFLEEQKIEPKLDCSVKFNGDLVKIREVIKSHLSKKTN